MSFRHTFTTHILSLDGSTGLTPYRPVPGVISLLIKTSFRGVQVSLRHIYTTLYHDGSTGKASPGAISLSINTSSSVLSVTTSIRGDTCPVPRQQHWPDMITQSWSQKSLDKDFLQGIQVSLLSHLPGILSKGNFPPKEGESGGEREGRREREGYKWPLCHTYTRTLVPSLPDVISRPPKRGVGPCSVNSSILQT